MAITLTIDSYKQLMVSREVHTRAVTVKQDAFQRAVRFFGKDIFQRNQLFTHEFIQSWVRQHTDIAPVFFQPEIACQTCAVSPSCLAFLSRRALVLHNAEQTDPSGHRVLENRRPGKDVVPVIQQSRFPAKGGIRHEPARSAVEMPEIVIHFVVRPVRRRRHQEENMLPDRKSTRLNSSHPTTSRMPSSA